MNPHSGTDPIRPLDDFICGAVPLKDVPQGTHTYSGRIQDLLLLQEIVLDASNLPKSLDGQAASSDPSKTPGD